MFFALFASVGVIANNFRYITGRGEVVSLGLTNVITQSQWFGEYFIKLSVSARVDLINQFKNDENIGEIPDRKKMICEYYDRYYFYKVSYSIIN